MLENLLLFSFVQFHCVEPTHKEVAFCSKWMSYNTFAVKKLGQQCSLFFVWRKFIILNASKATKQLEWRKRKIPQLWNKSCALSGQKLAKLLDLNLMQLKLSEGYFKLATTLWKGQIYEIMRLALFITNTLKLGPMQNWNRSWGKD